MTRFVLLIASAMPAFAQYAGPAMLTRGEVPTSAQPAQLDFRPYLDLAGIYDTGLTGVGVTNNQGDLANDKVFGVEAGFGVYGVHRWRRTSLGLDYRGNVRHYTRNTYYDGIDNTLSLGLTHQPTRHTILSVRTAAGSYTRSFGMFAYSGMGTIDPTLGYVPANDYFDNRTNFLSAQADFTYQKSARLSFNMGADQYIVRYRSSALSGMSGTVARGDVAYRLNRYSTIGVGYAFTHFGFTKDVGGTFMHAFAVNYSVALARRLELSVYGGAVRGESRFVRIIALDPAIAALLGRSTALALTSRVDVAPNVGARLIRGFRRGAVSLSGSRTMTPGNGIFLTSETTSGSLGYSYTAMRNWNVGVDINYSDSRARSDLSGTYRSLAVGAGATRKIGRYTHVRLRYDARKYDSGTYSNYNRWLSRATIGLAFAPGEIPLSLW